VDIIVNRLPVKRYFYQVCDLGIESGYYSEQITSKKIFYQFCDLGIKSGLDLGVRLSEGIPVLNAGESVVLQPDMDCGRLYFVGIKNWS